ncbi:acyltransferase family protein [Desulfosporosinus fructosivorans]
MQERIQWLDNAKGWGILLVMIGHTNLPGPTNIWVYSFHLPLFFFISGYLFNSNKYDNTFELIKAKARTLLIPYFFFSLIILLFDVLVKFSKFGAGGGDNCSSIINQFIGMFVQMRSTELSGVCWFLTLLFISEILLYWVLRSSKNNDTKSLLLLVASFISGWFYMEIVRVPLPWHVDAGLVATFFVGMGYHAKKYESRIAKLIKYRILLLALGVSLVCTYINYLLIGTRVDLYYSELGNPILFIIVSMSGVLASIIAIRKLPNIRFAGYIGRNSLTYYALHATVFYVVLNMILSRILRVVTENELLISYIQPILCVWLTCVLMVPVCYIINSYLPFILGRKRMQQK